MTSPTTSAIDQSKVNFPSEAFRQDNRDVLLQELLELFAFSQIRLVEGNIVPAVFLSHEAK